jgi:single-strand DNA-binding protein
MAERSINKVTLLGRLGADPEIKYTQSGQAVSTLNVATNHNWKDDSGVWQTKTDWHRVVVWGKLAETCHEYMKKGSKLYLEGSLQTRQYDDKDGQKRFITEVKMNDMIMLDSKGSNEGGGFNRNSTPSADQPGNDLDAPVSSKTSDVDDLPF